jgi:predicted small secreted protein
MNKFTRTLSVAVLLGAIGTLSACHTVEGIGKDVQEVGEEVEETAEETRN